MSHRALTPCASARSRATPSMYADRSTPVTSQPRRASSIACRPWPQGRSRIRRGGRSCNRASIWSTSIGVRSARKASYSARYPGPNQVCHQSAGGARIPLYIWASQGQAARRRRNGAAAPHRWVRSGGAVGALDSRYADSRALLAAKQRAHDPDVADRHDNQQGYGQPAHARGQRHPHLTHLPRFETTSSFTTHVTLGAIDRVPKTMEEVTILGSLSMAMQPRNRLFPVLTASCLG